MAGYRDETRQRLSDRTCTALQLVNFWQDVRRDFVDRGRIYLPRETMRQFGLTEESLAEQVKAGRGDDNFRRAIKFEIDRVESMFAEGEKLLPLLDRTVRGQVGLFGAGGKAIAAAIRRQGYDTIAHRPSLSRVQKGRLVMRGLAATLGRFLMPQGACGHRTAVVGHGKAVGNRVGEHECQLSR
jgi:phytoene/squalene synthetase